MTKEQAIALAAQFVRLQHQASSLPGDYLWVVAEPTEYDEAWYFDHTFAPRAGRWTNEVPQLAGAPGFLVCKRTQAVQSVSWPELAELPRRDALRRQAAQHAQELLSEALTLATLRRHLALPLPEVLALKKRLAESNEAEQRALLTAQLFEKALEG